MAGDRSEEVCKGSDEKIALTDDNKDRNVCFLLSFD